MQDISEKTFKHGLLIGAATLFASMVITSTSTATNYTAHGSTDVKTAKLLQTLLKNSHKLQVNTQVHRAPNNSGTVEINYTVSGKTDEKTARKLIQLFKTSKHIEVAVKVNRRRNSNRMVRQNIPQYGYPAAMMPTYYPNYPAVYMQTNYGWQAVAMWQRVPVPAVSTKTSAIINTDKSLAVAGR